MHLVYRAATFRQFASAATASISVIIVGTTLGWPSPVLPKVNEGQPFRMSTEEVSWMVSCLYLGNMLSPIPAGYLMDKFGRKRALLLLAIIPTAAWAITIYASEPWMLYLARFLTGQWTGIVSTITPMYLAEISEPRLRGALSTMGHLMLNIGILLEYIIGPNVSYVWLGYLSGTIPIIFIAIFCMMPESPYWLLMAKKKEEAMESLAWLRAVHLHEAKQELENMNLAVEEEMKSVKSLKDLVTSKSNRKALLIVQTLAIFQRVSGISALIPYTSTTLPSRGAGLLTPNDCVVVLGVVWVVSVFGATALVDSLGRKPLLSISSAGCGVAMFTAGLWFFLDELTNVDVSQYYWVPFGSFIVYGVFFSFGLGPVASTVQGEYFATNVKGVGSGLTSVVLALSSFIMNKIYHGIADKEGMYLNYWIFSVICFISAIFVICFVIETKGKSLHEIQEQLRCKKSSSVQIQFS